MTYSLRAKRFSPLQGGPMALRPYGDLHIRKLPYGLRSIVCLLNQEEIFVGGIEANDIG